MVVFKNYNYSYFYKLLERLSDYNIVYIYCYLDRIDITNLLEKMSTNTTIIELNIHKRALIYGDLTGEYIKMLSKNYTLQKLIIPMSYDYNDHIEITNILDYNNTLKEMIIQSPYKSDKSFIYYRPVISLESLCYNVIRSHQLPTDSIPKYILDRHKIAN